MSKIDELIKELCPDGVEWKELGEIGRFYNGLTGKSKTDFQNGNAKFVSYMNVFSNITINTNIDTFVKIMEEEIQNTVEYGDVLFTGSSET
ncbi:MAG TPA: restriction endonuclease subunit S, partial [Candidatus Cloacimonadota bacterium]|nr:restriction endonuclease subunit S [Candidatus Cloacimonadota bacterium]